MPMPKKYILITGSSRGIGKSAALLFAEKGFHVFLNCRRFTDELEAVQGTIERLGGSCTALPADVSNPSAVKSMFREIYRLCPCLDILINNAGISHTGLFTDMSDAEWDQVIRTNLSSAFYCAREAVPPMISKKAGRILNISSIWGLAGASCEAAYSASKAGLNGFTKALAKELAPSGIQVNALACGVIDTVMNRGLSAQEREALARDIPAGRFASAEEAAAFIFQLCSSPLYATAQIIGMDGGYL